MSQPFMQLYVADYLGDTRHLTTEQHGAYLLILMTMWRSGGRLPNDAKKLARITGCTPSRWTRIADEVMEFFDVRGDEITNPRLALELEKASEKAIQRANAGSLGGKANALKNNKPGEANARPPLEHSSEPESDKEEPPTPKGEEEVNLDRFSKALALGADAGCDFGLMVERIHKAQPVIEGKRRSALADVKRALESAVKRGGKPSAIWAAVQAYYALPASTKDGGQFARGAAPILNADRWKEFVGGAVISGLDVALAPVAFNGPAALRDSVVALLGETFARTWIDSCTWDGDTRTLEARDAYGASMLNTELEGWLKKMKVNVAVKGSSR